MRLAHRAVLPSFEPGPKLSGKGAGDLVNTRCTMVSHQNANCDIPIVCASQTIVQCTLHNGPPCTMVVRECGTCLPVRVCETRKCNATNYTAIVTFSSIRGRPRAAYHALVIGESALRRSRIVLRAQSVFYPWRKNSRTLVRACLGH
jgi:hypothetical protein